MGRKSATSWLTIVKRAFRSPTKDVEKNGSRRRRNEHDQEVEKKEREKRRWLFRKHSNVAPQVQHQQCEEMRVIDPAASSPLSTTFGADQKHVIAAMAAGAVTAQAAAEAVTLTRRPCGIVREQTAAVIIQTAFRGYLARRVLRALRGLVKLQALVRGQNLRRQTKVVLKSMEALVRVQDRIIRGQRARLSHDEQQQQQQGNIRKSLVSDVNVDLWEPKCQRHGNYTIWKSMRNTSAGNMEELEERTKWLHRWMAARQLDRGRGSRASISDRRDSNIKTVQVDTSCYCKYNSNPNHTPRRSLHYCRHNNQHMPHSPVTPSPSLWKPRPLHDRCASPRCSHKEERCFSAAHTPSFGSRIIQAAGCGGGVPNYMTATESAKAKARSQSTPRQRPSTPERDCGSSRGGSSARKRLSYVILPQAHYGGYGRSSFGQSLTSPCFKNICNGYI